MNTLRVICYSVIIVGTVLMLLLRSYRIPLKLNDNRTINNTSNLVNVYAKLEMNEGNSTSNTNNSIDYILTSLNSEITTDRFSDSTTVVSVNPTKVSGNILNMALLGGITSIMNYTSTYDTNPPDYNGTDVQPLGTVSVIKTEPNTT